MHMQTLSVKLLSCKILQTKYCVPFEVQYYSSGFIFGWIFSILAGNKDNHKSLESINFGKIPRIIL